MKSFCKYIVLAIFFSVYGITFAQNNDIDDFVWTNKNNQGIKKITVKVNDTIAEQQYFNTKGLPFFTKSERGDFYNVKYYKYDKQNRIIKKIQGHAVIGFSCDEIKYSKKKTEIFSFLTVDEKDAQLQNDIYLDNKAKGIEYTVVGQDTISIDDAYAVVEPDSVYYKYVPEIGKIKDTTALFNSPSFKKLISEPKYLSFSIEFDNKSRPIKQKYIDSRNKVTSLNEFYYSPGKIITKYKTDMIGSNQIIKSFDDEGNITSEKEGSKIIKYKYENKKCIEEKEFSDEKLLNTKTHIYNGDFLEKDIFDDIEYGNKFTTEYKYGDNQKLIQKIETSKYAKRIYTYEYEYY